MKPTAPDVTTRHPSFLALDRAYLGQASAEVAAHLTSCELCPRYLESLETPGHSSAFNAVRLAIDGEYGARRRPWFLAGLSLAAVACGVLFFVMYRTPRMPSGELAYIGEKGFRSVWIYVKHGVETELWDGKKPLSAGDRLRLKLDPGVYHRVAVYVVDERATPSLLFESAATPGRSLTLPDAWEIDDSRAPERLFVVFSDEATEPIVRDWLHGKVVRGGAVLPFVLPKTATDAGSVGP